MMAAQFDFDIQQGASFLLGFVWMDANEVPLPLEGYGIRLQMRPYPSSNKVLLDASLVNGLIRLGENPGEYWLEFPAATTRALNWRKGKYDIELTAPDGFVSRPIEGTITMIPEVTRDV